MAVTGRPTKYKPEYCKQAAKLCELGATDADLAEFFEVTESTINLWKLEHSNFSESTVAGKTNHDAEIELALARRAKGFMRVKQVFGPEGTIEMLQEEVPPDTNACSLWLRNRQPQRWRDKQEVEHSGELKLAPALEIIDPKKK